MKLKQTSFRLEDHHLAEWLKKAWQLRTRKQADDAVNICRQILYHHPDHAQALHLLGLLHWEQGDPESAVACLQQAIAIQPELPFHHNSLAVILNSSGDYSRASEHLQKALQIDPDYLDAKSNMGLALFHQGRFAQAADYFHTILSATPDHGPALANLGMVLLAQGNYAQAVRIYQKALTKNPGKIKWLGNLAASFMGSGQFQKAAACYKSALKEAPENVDYCVGLAVALRAIGDYKSSATLLRFALTLDPLHAAALVNLCIIYHQTCQWQNLENLYQKLDWQTHRSLEIGTTPEEQPLFNIRRSSELPLNLSVAKLWSINAQCQAAKCAKVFLHRRQSPGKKRINVGYLSYDFRDHPVAYQISPLFRHHDRSRFNVLAFSMGLDDDSASRHRIQNSCDAFIDIAEMDLKASAQTIYNHNVDILIDLMGHTHHNRMGILSLKPAPLQISYLGFLGSTGASYIDYIIADKVVVPEKHANYYSEKIIWMPDCYQLNHFELGSESNHSFVRNDFGLPEHGVVFCCFNKCYKIDAEVFKAWVLILKQVPDSVLWLYKDNPLAVENLKWAAKKHGIDPRRLVFAQKVSLNDHLKRLKLADIALDTITYNGGATTSNTLQSGVPVLTVLGRHWVSRMTASHLIAVGMPEMVARNLAEYQNKAIDLAKSPVQLELLKSKLKQNLKAMPLFNSNLFVSHFENGLQKVWHNYQCGLPPSHVNVSSCL